MGHTMASWKLLESMMIQLRQKGVDVPSKIVEDLRAAKSMINLSCGEGAGEAIQKAEEYTANVEAYLVSEGQKAFGSEWVDERLRQLEEANVETCGKPAAAEGKFVVGVPRDQKWVRVEPYGKLSAQRIKEIAEQKGLQVQVQGDGKLVAFGQPEAIKAFLKATAAETTVK